MGHEFEELSSRILGAAVEVHKALGPGFLESIYQRAMEVALEHRGIAFQRQQEVHAYFEEVDVGRQRLDLIVGGQIVLELKAVEDLEDIFRVFVLSCFRDSLGIVVDAATPPSGGPIP